MNNQYKEVKINGIKDIRIEDLIFYEGYSGYGIVLKKGKTFFHKHNFVEVICVTNFDNNNVGKIQKDIFYENDFIKGEIVLRKKSGESKQ